MVHGTRRSKNPSAHTFALGVFALRYALVWCVRLVTGERPNERVVRAAFAGYLVILRGRTFTVRDRITMGGVRGDVISLGFLQTRIMEMGEPPHMQGEPTATWVFARQYTGRIVS